jgi:hypothetical protein
MSLKHDPINPDGFDPCGFVQTHPVSCFIPLKRPSGGSKSGFKWCIMNLLPIRFSKLGNTACIMVVLPEPSVPKNAIIGFLFTIFCLPQSVIKELSKQLHLSLLEPYHCNF